jgi:hypothetical protein
VSANPFGGHRGDMTVDYEITPDDVTAFVRRVVRTDAGFRRQYVAGFIIGPMMGLLVVVARGHSGLWSSLATVAAVTALFSGYYMYFYRKQLAGNVRRAYGANSNEGPLGHRVMTIGPDGIQEVSDHATTSQKWSGIKKVEETDSAVYIFNAPASAFIIPKRAFSNGSALGEFLDDVSRFRSRRE